MFLKLIPFAFTLVGANPLFIGSSQGVGNSYGALNFLHHLQPSSLSSQHGKLFNKYGHLDRIASFSRNLLTSHVQNSLGGFSLSSIHHPSALAFASSPTHQATPTSLAISSPIRETEYPERITAGALVRNVPKVSRLPIKVEYSSKPLEFSSLENFNVWEGTPVSNSPFINGAGISFGY